MNGPGTLERLADRVREEGPPLMARPDVAADGSTVYGDLAAAGPRTRARGPEYAFVVEAVREGYLCHYGRSRVLVEPDEDLALLAGDLFYAIGISGLSDLDDLESTGILSDLIRVAAELQAAGRSDLAENLWVAQVVALSCGKSDVQTDLVKALETGDEEAARSLTEWSAGMAATNGLGREFDIARTAIDSRPSNS